MKLIFNHMNSWPPLAWLVHFDEGCSEIHAYVGRSVETCDEWLCEATWNGPYADGGFDVTDIVAGTGVRIRNNRAIFVSSGSTVDRLVTAKIQQTYFVSNSLPCLLSVTKSRPCVTYPYYHRDFTSIITGLKKYTKFIPTTKFNVNLIYFNNLCWDKRNLLEENKPNAGRGFKSFSEYYDFLLSCFQAISSNSSDKGRKAPLTLGGTLSSGYDSATVMSLAKKVGCNEAISFLSSRQGGMDSGIDIGNYLGVRVLELSRDKYQEIKYAEIPFYAAEGEGAESLFAAATGYLRGRVLLTGFHGDKFWDKETKIINDEIVRGDVTGLSLTEFRLREGFLHCPIPFWSCRNIKDIVSISNSMEMSNWDIGGSYNRPICRRIIETSGVPREVFGMKKAAVSRTFYERKEFLAPSSFGDYLQWISENRIEWIKKGKLPPSRFFDDLTYFINTFKEKSAISAMRWVGGKPVIWRSQKALTALRRRWQMEDFPPNFFRRYVAQWAIERASNDCYQDALLPPSVERLIN